jgi:cell division protein FtsN
VPAERASVPSDSRGTVRGDVTPEEVPHGMPLRGKSLVFVFMAATMAAVVVFLCGVMVGRGVQSRMLAASALPVDPTRLAPLPRPGTARPSGTVLPSSDEVLTYPRRLETFAQVPEPLHEPIPARPASMTPAVGSETGGPMVRVGPYHDRDAADAVAGRLAMRGYPSSVAGEAPGGQPLFWVRLGPYADRHEADTVRERLEREDQFRAVVVP